MSKIQQLNKKATKEDLMFMFISNMDFHKIPMPIFIARLKNIPVEISPIRLDIIDNAIIGFGGKEVWLNFLVSHVSNPFNTSKSNIQPLVGAHSDFIAEHESEFNNIL